MTPPAVHVAPGVVLHLFDLASLCARRRAYEAEASEEERARAARLQRPADRERFVLRRGALRRLLAERLGRLPEQVRLLTGSRGKPCVAHPRLRFSASSSGTLFAVALSEQGEVGVDVERLEPRADLNGIAAGLFPPAARARLWALPDAARLAGFYRLWTQAEALAKLDGAGIADGLPDPHLPAEALERDGRWALATDVAGPPRWLATRALGGRAVLSVAWLAAAGATPLRGPAASRTLVGPWPAFTTTGASSPTTRCTASRSGWSPCAPRGASPTCC